MSRDCRLLSAGSVLLWRITSINSLFSLVCFQPRVFCLLLWSRSCDNDTLVLPVSRVCFLVIDRHIIHIDLPLSLWWLFRSESFVSYICVESCVQKGWSISCYPPQIQTFFLIDSIPIPSSQYIVYMTHTLWYKVSISRASRAQRTTTAHFANYFFTLSIASTRIISYNIWESKTFRGLHLNRQ